MRRLILLLIALPTVALAADAGDSAPPAPAQAQDANAQPDQTPPVTLAPPAPPAGVAADPSDCRMACAQTYYFCRSNDDEQNCSPSWSRCVAACASPDLDPGVSTAP
jgi:hypothetical protein